MNSLSILAKLLVGNRDAILHIAQDRRWLKVGFLFVIAAGLAREYDAEYLIAEPWYLAIPIAASIVASFLLYCLIFLVFIRRADNRPTFRDGYYTFLTLFWLTAPLALLYGIPVERFMSEYNAAVANLWMLALVAAWRVLLFIRVISVLTGVHPAWAFFPVMLFSDVAALAGLTFSPQPIVSFMGGVRGTPTEALIAGVSMAIAFFGSLSLIVWIIMTFVCLASGTPHWKPDGITLVGPPAKVGPVFLMATASNLLWLAAMPWTQPEQHLKWTVDQHLAEDQIAEALHVMSSHSESEFPPHFDPRPRNYYGEDSPEILSIMEVLVTKDVSEWVRTLYCRKFEAELMDWWGDRIELSGVVPILEKLPDGAAFAKRLIDADVPYWDLGAAEKGPDAPLALRLKKLAGTEPKSAKK